MSVPSDGVSEQVPTGARPTSVAVVSWIFIALAVVITVLAAVSSGPIAVVSGLVVAVLFVTPAVFVLRGRHGGRIALTSVVTVIGYATFGAVSDARSTSELVVPPVSALVLVALTALLWSDRAQAYFGRPGPSPVRPCAVATAICAGWMVVVFAVLIATQGPPGRGLVWALDITIAVSMGAGMLTHLFARKPGRSWAAIVAVALVLTVLALSIALRTPGR